MSIFDTLSLKLNELIPQFVQTKPAPQAAKALEAAKKLGEEVRAKVAPVVEKAKAKYVPTIINVFENISRAAGMFYKGLQTTDEVQLLKPISEIFGPTPGAKTITEALAEKPMLYEEVAKATKEFPVVGGIPGVPIVAGLLSELLLPPYFGKGSAFINDLAKTTTKSATKELLLKGVKEISESEADTLASKLAPITDKKLIQTELDTFAKSKAIVPQISPKIAPEIKTVGSSSNEIINNTKLNLEGDMVKLSTGAKVPRVEKLTEADMAHLILTPEENAMPVDVAKYLREVNKRYFPKSAEVKFKPNFYTKIAEEIKPITPSLQPLAQEALPFELSTEKMSQKMLKNAESYSKNINTKFDEGFVLDTASKIAKLDNSDLIKPQHLAEALQYTDPVAQIKRVVGRIEEKAKYNQKITLGGKQVIETATNSPFLQRMKEIFGEQKYQDFYNQSVGGVKVALKEPQITIKPVQTIADEAIKFAKENPESSLVAKEFRNPRTKELEGGPLLFKRIGDAIRDGEINLDELPKIVTKYGLSAENTAKLFEDAATYSGRTLQALSRVEKELRALLPDIVLPERIPTLWEHVKSTYLAIDNFRRGLLVTQLATAARNAISQAGRYTLGTITDGMNGVLGKIIGQKESFTPFFEDIAAILRKTEKGNVEKLQNVLRKNPIENARLYNTPVGDVALTGKITNTLNAFNRGQEYFFRNLILDAKMNAAAKMKGIPIEKLGLDDIEKAVGEALEWTYSKTPIRGSFGDAIMRTYRAMPFLTLINPFPRFMSNAMKFIFDYSPLGITNLFSSKTRMAIAAGDYNVISKAIIGTSMLGAALAVRANENLAGEKWYEIKWGDKVIDTRPFAPFSTYLLFGEVMLNGGKNLTGSDWAQAAIGINRVAGTGLALIDLIQGNVDYKNAKDVVSNVVATYIGGFTVPFNTIKDVIGNFRLEERTTKETRDIPIIGGAIGNIPGLNELLPTKYSMFEDKPLQREQTLLRQLTGITLKTKSYIEKELDRMGKQIGDLVPKTGNLEANRIISKQTGVILDKYNEKIKMSEKYQAMDDNEKLDLIKNLISEAKSEAKGEMASDLAGVVYNELKKVSSDKRKEVVKNLKGRGLLTENILDYLLPMIEAQPLP